MGELGIRHRVVKITYIRIGSVTMNENINVKLGSRRTTGQSYCKAAKDSEC